MTRMLLATAALVVVAVPAAADWSGSPYEGRTTYHNSTRPNESAGVKPQGHNAVISPAGKCWLVTTTDLPADAPPGAWKQYIPFKSSAEFESYRAGKGQAGHPPEECAFNMPVSLCGADVGQTGHRALGTVVGPFTYDTGEDVVTLTLRADRQGTGSDYGWSVASQSGSCEADSDPDCSDPDYRAAHPDRCVVQPLNCSDPDYAAQHPAQCGSLDPYCPAGYTASAVLGLTPTYYDASGPGTYNPNTVVGCASPSALATPTSCPASDHQSFQSIRTDAAPYGFPAVWFCGYYGALDNLDYDNQWGDFPTVCANDFGSGAACGAAR